MFQLIYAYVVGLGPFILLAIVLGIAIPLVLLLTKPSKWLLAFAVLFLCLVPFGRTELTGAAEGSVFRQVGWGGAFLLGLLFAVRQGGTTSVPWKWVPLPYALLLVYALLSASWSEVPWVSLKRTIQLVGVAVVALAIVRHGKSHNFLSQFTYAGVVFLFFGVVGIAVPGLGIDPWGNYKGFTFTKNTWGQFSLLMALVFALSAFWDVRRRTHWLLFCIALISLAATRSATTIIVAVTVAAMCGFWGIGHKLRVPLLPALLVGLSGAVLVTLIFATADGQMSVDHLIRYVLGAIGKDDTFTGRTVLWRWMDFEIAKHPWFGAGYGGFWVGHDGPSSAIVRFFSWRPGQAHNGYIDTLNELGYFGFGIVLMLVSVHISDIVKIWRCGNSVAALGHSAVFLIIVLLNFSETSLLRATNLWWIVFSLSVFAAHARRGATVIGGPDECVPALPVDSGPLLGRHSSEAPNALIVA